MLSFTLILSFNACSDGDDNGNQNPAPSPTTVTTESVTTSGTVSSSTVTVSTSGAQTTAQVNASSDGKSYYEFTESTSVSANISSRTVTVDDAKGGTWKFFENEALKYTGTYKGDISDFSEVLQDNTTSEGLKLELTVTEVANDSGDLVEVTTSAADATFEFVVESATDTSSFTFVAIIPAVEAKKEESPAQGDADSVTITYPTASELAGKNFKIGETTGSVGYLSFSADGTSATYISYLINDSSTSKLYSSTYEYKNGELLSKVIDRDGNETEETYVAYTLIKGGSAIYLLDEEKFTRTSGSGLYATFSYTKNGEKEDYKNNYNTTIVINGEEVDVTCYFTEESSSSGSESYTFNSNGSFTGSSNFTHSKKSNYDYKDSNNTVLKTEWSKFTGTETSTSTGTFTNSKGVLTLSGTKTTNGASGGESSENGKWTNEPSSDTENINKVALYDGTYIYPIRDKLVSVSALPERNVYNIEKLPCENGTLLVTYQDSSVGATTEFQVTPASGYVIKKVSVTDESDREILVKWKSSYNGTENYAFVMPNSDVTISAEFMVEASRKYSVACGNTSAQQGYMEFSVASDSENKYLYSAGQTVNFQVRALSNNTLEADTLLAVDANNNKIELKATGKETFYETMGTTEYPYSFVMPESNVTITCSFKSPTLYTVSFPSVEGASVYASGSSSSSSYSCSSLPGKTITGYVRIDSNYEFESLKIINANSEEVSFDSLDFKWTNTTSETYKHFSFVMPEYDVTLTPVLKALTTYTITQDESGKTDDNQAVLTVSEKSAAGKTVGISVSVMNGTYGYDVDEVTVTKEGGDSVEVSEDTDSSSTDYGAYRKYSFVMPESPVTVKVTYELIAYAIDFAEMTNGSITANPASATKWQTVTLTVSPESGYQLETIEVSNGEESYSKNVYATKIVKSGKEYTFTMPANKILVSATFKTATTAQTKTKADAVGDVVLSDGTAVAAENVSSMSDEQKDKAVAVIFYAGGSSDALGEKVLGVGLYNTAYESTHSQWAPKDTTGYTTNFSEIVCTPSEVSSSSTKTAETATFTGDTDGSDNWSVITSTDTNAASSAETNYPCFYWANNYGAKYSLPDGNKNDWYIPSIAELAILYRVKDTVNASLASVGGIIMYDGIDNDNGTSVISSFWSSSQVSGANGTNFAYYLIFQNGYLGTDSSRYIPLGKSDYHAVCAIHSF